LPSGTSGSIRIPKFRTMRSEAIFLNDTDDYTSIEVTAKTHIPRPENGEYIKIYACADGATETWEEVVNITSTTTVVVSHTFSTTGKEIRIRIDMLGISGADLYVDKNFKVKNTTGN